MSRVSLTVRGETIEIDEAAFDFNGALLKCRYSEELALAFTGYMPVEVQLHLPPCKFPITFQAIDIEVLQLSRKILIEVDGLLSE